MKKQNRVRLTDQEKAISLEQVLGRKIDPGELSLAGLGGFPLDTGEARQRCIEGQNLRNQYKEKYGRDWLKRYIADTKSDYDEQAKFINEVIYGTGSMGTSSNSGKLIIESQERLERRRREVYGDAYDELKRHPYHDPRVGELLISDAIRTGKWKELPDELQPMYHERIGGGVS